jgi:hypothetical protein
LLLLLVVVIIVVVVVFVVVVFVTVVVVVVNVVVAVVGVFFLFCIPISSRDRRCEGEEEVFKAKLFVVGESQSGKTTLVKALARKWRKKDKGGGLKGSSGSRMTSNNCMRDLSFRFVSVRLFVCLFVFCIYFFFVLLL